MISDANNITSVTAEEGQHSAQASHEFTKTRGIAADRSRPNISFVFVPVKNHIGHGLSRLAE